MQKYLNVFIAGILLLLAGCQTNPHRPASSFNNPFNNFIAPSETSQANLAQSVQEAFMRHDDLAVSPIRVEARQNTVILSGYVKKIRQSDTAEQIARQVPGVGAVENRIIVRP